MCQNEISKVKVVQEQVKVLIYNRLDKSRMSVVISEYKRKKYIITNGIIKTKQQKTSKNEKKFKTQNMQDNQKTDSWKIDFNPEISNVTTNTNRQNIQLKDQRSPLSYHTKNDMLIESILKI